MPDLTFPDALAAQQKRDGARPFVTFYDDATGERVELSVTTYANWVAKTASLLQDDLMLERGASAVVDLPTHWLGPVWLGALWTLGASVSADPAEAAEADLVVCGPDGVDRYAGTGPEVVALSLLPMGRRFSEPLPDGVVDFGEVVWAQPDVFFAADPAQAADPAWQSAAGTRSQSDLLHQTRGWTGGRPLTDLNPVSGEGLELLLGPLQTGLGAVWVRNADPEGWAHRADSEQARRYPTG